MKKKIGLVFYLRNVSFLFLLFGFNVLLNAQTFSKNREKFLKESQKLFIEEQMEYNVNQVFPSVIANASSLSEGNFNRMVDAANAVYSSSNDIQLTYFMVATYVYQSKNKWSSDFTSTWVELERDYRAKDAEDYGPFLEFSYNLFRFKALHKNDNSVWVFKGDMQWNTEKKLKIICSDGQLLGYSPVLKGEDSVWVSETGGVFEYETKKFIGRNGTITWEKTGLKKSETFAELKGYRIAMTDVVLKADTVSLTTPYFTSPILGALVDKSKDRLEDQDGAPLFSSFSQRLRITELKEFMDFDGGFSLQGSRVVGAGKKGNPATLIFKYKNKPTLIVSSLHFDIDPTRILSRESSLKLVYPNGDSLVHPSGLFEFEVPKNQLLYTATKRGSFVLPFMDYHFNVTNNAPVLKWEPGTAFPKFTFEMATSQAQKSMQFESLNYFDQSEFKLWGVGNQNSLVQIAGYCRKNSLEVLSEGQAANALGLSIDYAKSKLLDLSMRGFLQYNTTDKTITPSAKLFSFADANSNGLDYDNISFTCDLKERPLPASTEPAQAEKIKKLNARYVKQDFYAFIDLDKDQVFLTGVDGLTLSNAQQVSLYPDSGYCILKPNRDLIFKGQLLAGKLFTELKDAYFSYAEFKVQLNNTTYAALVVNPMVAADGDQPIELVSSFANLKGEILIDEPTSKSGRSKTNKAFPKLLAPNPTKVVYNDQSIVNGAYDSSRFFFRLEPFELDSLDNFNEASQRFKGELISGGIFPPIKEPLRIMPDYSMGFSTVAPAGGWAFYGDNSKYENKVILSHNGLQGAGTINYSTATAISQKLTFLPDSTIGIAKFINKESITGVKVPSVTSEAALVTFIPKKQVLKASAWRGVNLQMFNNQCEMEGSVILSIKGMRGTGMLHFPDADLGSRDFSFTHEDIFADTSSFALKNRFVSEGQAPVAMETKDVKSNVSFKTRKGEFNSFGTKRIKFPPNQYYCTMDKFFWYMDKANVDFEKSKSQKTTFEAGADLEESNFFSMHEDQDTLQFRSLLASYDLKLQTLFCGKVEYVRVGDAKIYPDSMKVTVRKNAVMDPLNNAKIVAPFVTKFHTFTNANINISSRKKYEGNAKYPYYDRDSVLTVLDMKTIKYFNSVTQAEGVIAQKDNFKLSKEFDYFGNIKIVAASPGIYCDGSTKLNHSCRSFDRSWLNFKDTILAKNIQIPISENPVNDLGRKLAVGFLWKNSESMDSVLVYPAFLSKTQGIDDPVVFTSSGYVQYNPNSLTFQIGEKPRLSGVSDVGNLLTMYTETCSLTGLGKISFGVNLGEVSANSFGSISYENESKKIGMDVSTLIKFPMQKDVFDKIGDGLKALESQKNVDMNSKKLNFSTYLRQMLSEEKVNELLKDYEEDKLRKMPVGLDQTLVISGLKFDFVRFKTKANESGFSSGWITRPPSGTTETDEEGDEVKAKTRCAIIAIEGKPILKEVEFNMAVSQTAIEKSYQGLLISFKDQTDKDFLFDYGMNRKDGKLLVYSKDSELKTMVTEMKPDKRKSKDFSFEWTDDASLQLAMVRLKEFLRAK